jgi:hypothetical protein
MCNGLLPQEKVTAPSDKVCQITKRKFSKVSMPGVRSPLEEGGNSWENGGPMHLDAWIHQPSIHPSWCTACCWWAFLEEVGANGLG